MNVLTFGLVGAEPLGDLDFFGLPLVTVGDDEVRAFGVEAHGPPATDQSTLLAYDGIVRGLAAERAVIPHRFGVIAATDRIASDLRRNRDVLVNALRRVDGRDEWTVHVRPRVDDVVQRLPAGDRSRVLAVTAPLERGALVHRLMTDAAGRAGRRLSAALETAQRTVHTTLHDDALGADVIVLMERSIDVPSAIDELTADVRETADVELVGPGPAYRSAGFLTRFLQNDGETIGAR